MKNRSLRLADVATAGIVLISATVGLSCSTERRMEISAGPFASARSDFGNGAGWFASFGINETGEARWIQDYFRGRIDQSSYDGQTLWRVGVEKFTLGRFSGGSGFAVHYGWMGYWTGTDDWGTGPTAGIGFVWGPIKKLAVHGLLSVSLWLGSEDFDFSSGGSGEASAGLALTF